jgi:hypothetical protein
MIRDESGRFTVEATLIFPVVFLLTLSSLIVTGLVAKQTNLITEAIQAADRATFVWDNSYKNTITGAFYPDQYDDLYWRLTQDYSDSPLAHKKLSAVLERVPAGITTKAAYRNQLILRKITTKLGNESYIPSFVTPLYSNGTFNFSANSTITEPVEFIRQIDLALHYWPLIRNSLSKEQTDDMIEQFRSRDQYETLDELKFNSHNEARAYLQKLVRGHKSTRLTDQVGEWRLIDALDSYGIAHQAYFGDKSLNGQIEDQLLKDVEILSKGQVNGVVWHFFRRSVDDAIGPSDSLRKRLEERGIVVVVHD